MKKIALAAAVSMTAALSAGTANAAAHGASIMEGMAACNAEYRACLKGGTNMSIASTPSEGLDTMQSNGANWAACNSAQLACYQSLK